MAIKVGRSGQLAYNTSGAGGAGTWVVINQVADVTLTLETGTDDVSTRGSGSFRVYAAVLKDVEAEAQWPVDHAATDAGFSVLRTYMASGSSIGIRVLDAASGSGIEADFYVTKIEESTPLDGAARVTCSFKLASSANAVEYIGT